MYILKSFASAVKGIIVYSFNKWKLHVNDSKSNFS